MSRLHRCGLMLALALIALPAAAAPSHQFEALGQAPVLGGDRVRARDRALDEALRQAVEQAAGVVLPPADLARRASELELRIYPHARAYVTTYRVLDEGEVGSAIGPMFQVHLGAEVALGRLTRDLGAMPQAGPAHPAAPTAAAQAVVCVAVKAPGIKVDDVGIQTLRELPTAHGVNPLSDSGSCDEDTAAKVARTTGAQGALTGTIEVSPAGPIRGTNLVSAHARAEYHLVESGGRVSAEGQGEHDAYDLSLDRAGTLAARAATLDAAQTLTPALVAKWGGSHAGGGVEVKLSHLLRYVDYVAVSRALAALPGVTGVEPRRFSPAEVDLWVRTTAAPAELAAGLERLPPSGVRLSAHPAGAALTIEVLPEELPEKG